LKFNLHAVSDLARRHFPGDDEFSLPLPLDIADGATLEDVSALVPAGSFDIIRQRSGTEIVDTLQGIGHALIHRFEPRLIVNPETQELVSEAMQDSASTNLINLLSACLRIIRPTRENITTMHGNVRMDRTLDVMGFAHPIDLMNVPVNQKLFSIRNQDITDLIAFAPGFLRAMRGDFWKFRMAVQFYQLGFYQQLDYKARYLLWASAIESLFTSNHQRHRTSIVAIARIHWFLGADASIYPPGELTDLVPNPQITIRDITADLYRVRNYIAHGDRMPDNYFLEARRPGLGPDVVNLIDVLMEAQSFIIRKSLLKILREDLLDHFADADAAQDYFAANHLTKDDIRPRRHPNH
jgi:hypothetical protein